MQDIGGAIRSNRIKKGMTQKELGEKVGVGQHRVSYWESGKHRPNLKNAKKVGDLLGFDFFEFYI